MIETVNAVLYDFGWKFDLTGEDHVITGFKSDLLNRSFTIHIFWSTDWIVLTTSLLKMPIHSDLDQKISSYVARTNYYMPVVKYSISDNDELMLSVELPQKSLTKECLLSGLEMLCIYSEEQTEALSQIIEVSLDKPDSD